LTLIIKVEKVVFEADACKLRISGKNIGENEYISLGSYHSIEIEPFKKFTLSKMCWDIIVLEDLETACDIAKKADLAAVIMQEGIAHICLVLSSMTVMKAKIEQSIPKIRKGLTNSHDKALNKFYLNVLRAIMQNVDFSVVKCLVIASPGFVRDDFYKFSIEESLKVSNKDSSKNEFAKFYENRDKILKLHSSDGYKHSLRDVLSAPGVSAQLADTKAATELKALDEFYDKLIKSPDWAVYGKKEVFAAHAQAAIKVLLVSDQLFRSANVKIRKTFVDLVENVRLAGGNVLKFSSMHVTGERLNSLTGIAAILRFPINFDEFSSDSEFEVDIK